jgi:hypothetical protein
MTTETEAPDRVILSYPKGIKATKYTTSSQWELYKDETMFLSFEIQEKYAQHENVPRVQCRAPRERREHSYILGDPSGRFLLIVEGWGCPDVPAWDGRTRCPVHDRARFRPYLARFRDSIIAYSSESRRKVLVDVHEALTAPHHMNVDERGQANRSFREHWGRYRDGRMTLAEFRATVARDAFPGDEDFEIMSADPGFTGEFDDELRRAIARDPEIVEKFDRLLRGA